MPLTDDDAIATEVRLLLARGVGEEARTWLEARCHGDALLHHQCARGVDERGEELKALPIGLGRVVDVEVVGVSRGDDCDVGGEMMEGAVELIGFDDGVVALLRDEAIGLVVIRDTAEEGVAVDVAGAQQVR